MYNKRLNKAWNDWTVHEMMKRKVGIVNIGDMDMAFPRQNNGRVHHYNDFGKEYRDS